MASRVVRKHDLERALKVFASQGKEPACVDLLPGGAVRLHMVEPRGGTGLSSEKDAQLWDEALRT